MFSYLWSENFVILFSHAATLRQPRAVT